MRIKRIRMFMYKRFHDLTIDLGDHPKRIVALVGPNGCGKSSVFDAMLYYYSQYNIVGNHYNMVDSKYHSLNNVQNYDRNMLSITFDFGDFRSVVEKLQKANKGNILFSFRSSFRYNGNLNVKEMKSLSDIKSNDYGANYASALDQRIDDNYRRLNIKYNKYLNETDCRPSEAKKHIIGELNDAISNCLNLEIDNLGNIESSEGTIFFRKEDTEYPFQYNVLSAGEKEVIDILLDLYLRKDDYDESIYIIDEPELHLNTAIQRKLIIEINKMIPDNCQIWIATHSIGFLRALQDELNDISQIIEFKEDNHWAAETYTLTPMVKSRNNWKKLFSTALDDLTGLISPKQIIYCEGRAEPNGAGLEQGLDADVYNTIFGEKHPEALFISSGGNTELDQRSDIALRILTKVFNDIDILVLKDRDMASGKKTTEQDRLVYLNNNPINHRVLKRFEIENYLYDKEVLKKYCDINNLAFDESAYDDFIIDISNQEVKNEAGRIKNYCNINGSINAETFKRNLAKVIDDNMSVYKELEEVIFERK